MKWRIVYALIDGVTVGKGDTEEEAHEDASCNLEEFPQFTDDDLYRIKFEHETISNYDIYE